MRRFKVTTYNIHKGRGLDRRVQIQRIAEVLAEAGGDILALQEVLSIEGKKPEDHQAHYIAHVFGFYYRIGENRTHQGGSYGNVTLSRFPILSSHNYDISQPGREKRGCLRTELQVDSSRMLDIFNLHLGTSYRERRAQARKLFDSGILKPEARQRPQIILGDFNEWISGLSSRLLKERFKSAPVRPLLGKCRTYPGFFPLVHLDHIYFDGDLEVEKVTVHRSRKALVASDHLPITVDFRIANSDR